LKYILFTLYFILLIGCNNHSSNNKNREIKDNIPKSQQKEVIKNFNNKLIFFEKNREISYKIEKKQILVFINNSTLSKEQIEELRKNKIDFFKTSNKELENYFDIKIFPTLIIIEKNKTKKYEGFIPSEILKYELKD